MVISLFSIEKEYFKNLCYPVILLFFLYFPFIVGINSARADYEVYVRYFSDFPILFSENYLSNLSKFRTELGFGIFISFVKLFTNSSTVFFIIFCSISFVFRFFTVKYFARKEDIILVLFAFLAHEFLRKDCVQIRNGFASAIVLFSLISLYKGYKLRFCIGVLMASMFQMTALMAIPLVGINSDIYKKTFRIMQYVLLIAIISTFFFSIKEILYIFERLGIIPSRVLNYLYWSRYSRPMPIYHPVILKQVVLCFLFLFIKKDILLSANKMTFFLFKIYFVSTLYYLIFRDFELLAGRFGSLFSGVEALFLLEMIYSSNIKQKKLVKLGVYVLISSLFIMNILTFTSTLSFKATFQ